MSEEYTMRISLNVLNHLGINLYSNIPAVLSEIVANAWDADATKVDVTIDTDKKTMSVLDNGSGMTSKDLNTRYLEVGYDRRKAGYSKTKMGRKVMGRKGIGKLSIFSIANEVCVYSVKDGERNGLRMGVEEIRKSIDKGEAAYHPEKIEDVPDKLNGGTLIVLRKLKKQINLKTEHYLRTRIARRFSIIGARHKFQVIVNNHEITLEDRDVFGRLDMIWTYGDGGSRYVDACRHLKEKPDGSQASYERVMEVAMPNGSSAQVGGWIGAARESSLLKEQGDGEDLNRISVLVRGKLAQEDVLDFLGQKGVYASYLIGELSADFLDQDDMEDSATSSRQSIKEDDERFVQLKASLAKEIVKIGRDWNEIRQRQGGAEAKKNPVISEWFKGLNQDEKRRANRLFGQIHRIIGDEGDRNRFYKQGVIAFESLKVKHNLDALESIDPNNLEEFNRIFAQYDDIEASLYYQVVRERLEVISAFNEKVDANHREKVIQKYLFDHLWLLDPAWERATRQTPNMERALKTLFEKGDAALEREHLDARLDIAFRKTSGRLVVVELKRAGRRCSTTELVAQCSKYREGLAALLDRMNPNESAFEIVVVVGKDLKDWSTKDGRKISDEMLKTINTRVMTYDGMIHGAYQAYSEFLKKQEDAGRVLKLMQDLDDVAD